MSDFKTMLETKNQEINKLANRIKHLKDNMFILHFFLFYQVNYGLFRIKWITNNLKLENNQTELVTASPSYNNSEKFKSVSNKRD